MYQIYIAKTVKKDCNKLVGYSFDFYLFSLSSLTPKMECKLKKINTFLNERIKRKKIEKFASKNCNNNIVIPFYDITSTTTSSNHSVEEEVTAGLT